MLNKGLKHGQYGVNELKYSSISEHAVFCHHCLTNSNTLMSERGEVVPILCPGDRSDGVWAGLSPGQEGLTTGQLSLTDLQLHPQASPLKGRTHPCSLLSVSSSS